MTPGERVAEWVRAYGFICTDESRFALFAELKLKRNLGDKVAGEALGKVMELWLRDDGRPSVRAARAPAKPQAMRQSVNSSFD